MGFLTNLFGGTENTLLTVILALAVVLVLIVLGVWILKVIFQATGNVARGRNKRLAVVDSMAIDPKRQLVLVRRDNVEHLVLVGGNADFVVETDITPPTTANLPSRRRTNAQNVANLTPNTTDDVNDKTTARGPNGRHPGLLRASGRREPDLNPQPLTDEQRFDEAIASDSVKSKPRAKDIPDVPEVSPDGDMDSGSAIERQSGKKKRRG